MNKIIVSVFLIALNILGCANVQAQPKLAKPTIKNSARETTDKNLKMMEASKLQSELGAIEGQIANLDGMIISAQARIESYQSVNTPGKEGMIAGAKGELMSYQG